MEVIVKRGEQIVWHHLVPTKKHYSRICRMFTKAKFTFPIFNKVGNERIKEYKKQLQYRFIRCVVFMSYFFYVHKNYAPNDKVQKSLRTRVNEELRWQKI